MVYRSEMEAECAARMAHRNVILGKRIVARGPAAQRSKGHSAEYEGKLGYVPTCKNDKRRLTDCIHYINGDCTSGTEVHTIYNYGKSWGRIACACIQKNLRTMEDI